MNILEALTDKALFGRLPAFQRLGSWRPWLAFLKAVYGLPMDGDDLREFQAHTGRMAPREGGYPEACAIVGCQSGKSQVAALVGVHEAAKAVAAKMTGVFVPLIAQDARGAQRALFGYVREAVEKSPVLTRAVVRETANTIELEGGVSLAVYPCRPASVRGIRAMNVVVDELAFFTATDGRPTDTEMLRACRSRVATTGGKLLILSSPYAAAGALWDLHRRHFAREDSPTLVWQASAPDMNPLLPKDYLDRMLEDDPEAYRSEVLGEFRAGVTTLLDPEALDEVVVSGVRERMPEPGIKYYSFIDAASGSGGDAFALGVAHMAGPQAVLDCIRSWKPPFNPSGVIAEVADLLKKYRCREAYGDRYGGGTGKTEIGGFVPTEFRKHGVTKRDSSRDRSEIYLEILQAVNAARVLLLDDAEMLREFRGLERRRGTGGKDKVDHRRGGHDDRANAAAGALVQALAAVRRTASSAVLPADGSSTGRIADGQIREDAAGQMWIGTMAGEEDQGFDGPGWGLRRGSKWNYGTRPADGLRGRRPWNY